MIAVAALLGLGGCHDAPPPAQPEKALVLPAAAAGDLLKPCARPAGEPADQTWVPGAPQVAALERALPQAVSAAAKAAHVPSGGPGESFAALPAGWLRQYAGIERDGRRLIVGNFVVLAEEAKVLDMIADRHPDRDPAAFLAREPLFACDGGARNFGVEWDPAESRFTAIVFDGAGRRHLSPYSYDLR